MSNATPEAKQLKHDALDEAIDHVRTVLERVERLHNRITESDNGVSAGDLKKPVCLSSVLNYGPERLNGTVNEIHDALIKLEQELF